MELPPIAPRVQPDLPTIPTFKEFLGQPKSLPPVSAVTIVSVVVFCLTCAVIYIFIANWLSIKRISVRTGLSSTGGLFPTLSNTGVLSLTQGSGITLTGSGSEPTISNSGVLSVDAGTGCTNGGTAQNRVINCVSSLKGFSTASLTPVRSDPYTLTCTPHTLSDVNGIRSEIGDVWFSEVINANFGSGTAEYSPLALCNTTFFYKTSSSLAPGDQMVFKHVISNVPPQSAPGPGKVVEVMYPLSDATTPTSTDTRVELHTHSFIDAIEFNGAQTLYITVYACYISSGTSTIDVVLDKYKNSAVVFPASPT